MGFPTKDDHFGAFWGYHHLRKLPHVTKIDVDRCEMHLNTTTSLVHTQLAYWCMMFSQSHVKYVSLHPTSSRVFILKECIETRAENSIL